MEILRRVGVSVLVIYSLTVGLCYGQGVCEQSLSKGLDYAVQGKYRDAKVEFEKALKVDPFYQPAKQALKVIGDVINRKIESKTATHFFKGAVFGNRGQHDQAISDFSKAIEIEAKFAEAYLNRGIVYAQAKGQYDQAISDFSKAIEIDPGNADAHVNRGLAYTLSKGQYDQAIADFNRAIGIDPKLPMAYRNRGLAYRVKGQHDQAVADFNKAIEINPKDAMTYVNRGLAYEDKGQHDQAISDFNKAIEINPMDAEAYNNRGFVYMVKLGNKEKACSDWKRACELGNCRNYNTAKSNGHCK
jgi:tetratricopeptide (TPR) repeat protein